MEAEAQVDSLMSALRVDESKTETASMRSPEREEGYKKIFTIALYDIPIGYICRQGVSKLYYTQYN